jgi:hypothetical protein
MNNNKYNLSMPKLGMAKYLASRELSLISHLDVSPRSAHKRSWDSSMQSIPQEGKLSPAMPTQSMTFQTKPNFQFGGEAQRNRFLSTSTLENIDEMSNISGNTGSMKTPCSPRRANQCPRKSSYSTISTNESNFVGRNRLGSIEQVTAMQNIFLSP